MDRRTCTQISAKLMLLDSHVCVNSIRNVSYIKICVNKMSQQIDVFIYKTGKIPTYLIDVFKYKTGKIPTYLDALTPTIYIT